MRCLAIRMREAPKTLTFRVLRVFSVPSVLNPCFLAHFPALSRRRSSPGARGSVKRYHMAGTVAWADYRCGGTKRSAMVPGPAAHRGAAPP